MFIPKLVNNDLTLLLNESETAYDSSVKQYVDIITKEKGYNFWAVNQSRGYCHYLRKTVTIPVWAFKRGSEYLTWYIAHECSHTYAGHSAKHGPEFMQWLQRICPTYALHYETSYKPRNAVSSGISRSQEINMITLEDLL